MSPKRSALPAPVAEALGVWFDRHRELAPGLVEGLYVVGSLALDDWRPGSDIDIVVTTADPPTDDDADRLQAAFEATRRSVAIPIDGPIVPWSDLAAAPLAAMRPWTLDGEFHFDGDCFEINPVTWYTLATRGIAVAGAAGDELGIHVDTGERISWIVENVDTYWRGVAARLRGALDGAPGQSTFDADAIEWCVLGAARMLFTATAGEVASKSAAGEWAAHALPRHAELLRAAVDIRVRHDADEQIDRSVAVATVDLLDEAVERITS